MPLPDVPPGSVDELAVDYGRLVLEHAPGDATSFGLHDRDDELPPITAADLDARERALRDLADRVRGRDASGGEELDRRGLLALIAADLARLERHPRRNPYAWVSGGMGAVLSLLIGAGVDDAARQRCVPPRSAAVPAYLGAARELLEVGDIPPLWLGLATAAARRTVRFFREVVPAAVPAAEEPGAAAAEAFAAFADWLEERAEVAEGSFVAGEERLGHLLRTVHLLDDGPRRIRERGEELVLRFEAQLREAAGRDDWQAELERAKGDHPSREGLLDRYRDEFGRLRAFCADEGLVTDPGAPAELAATPEPLREVLGYAAYHPPGPFDDVLAGQLWVTPPPDDDGLRDHAHALIPAITAHEGYPGHHLQITSVGRLPSVTRRLRISDLMVEGWGLYVEELLAEVGYYDDEARLGQLSLSLLRAARIVLDMGLHLGEVTVDEATSYLTEQVGLSVSTARSEVVRYTMTPTQPFAYLLGAEEIRRLRGTYLEYGEASLRDFHDALLSHGHLPPALAAEGLLTDLLPDERSAG